MKESLNFYKKIIKNSIPLTQLLKDQSLFKSVPRDWSVVVTDIEDSTDAIARGYHNDINLSATGSIITVLNTIKTLNKNIQIPYFFGGDGATFIIPNTILDSVLLALKDYSLHTNETLNLNLRYGHVAVNTIYKNEFTLRIAKLKHNKYLTTPVVLGNGMKHAENIIKETFKSVKAENKVKVELNLKGMECRWDEIYPNKSDKKVMCLLVNCEDEEKQADVFGTIMNEINYVFGDLEERNPITTLKLKLNTSIKKIKKEMFAKLGRHKNSYLFSNWLVTIFGKYYFKFSKAGQSYVYKVTQLSDTIMLDGSINTIISGTSKQINKFQIFLDNLESKNEIVYGLHKTHASIMSCYIEDRDKKHIHFVDGTEGGYTSAAIKLKSKLK